MRRLSSYRLFSAAMLSALCSAGYAGCTLKLLSVEPCNGLGVAGRPFLEDGVYGVLAKWTVTGTANKVEVGIDVGPNHYVATNLPVTPGTYYAAVAWPMPVDGNIPYKVILDPNHVSGDPSTTGHILSSSYTPIPPTTAIHYFAPLSWRVSETGTFTIPATSTVSKAFVILGRFTTGTSQRVISATQPTGTLPVTLLPLKYPTWVRKLQNPAPGIYPVRSSATVTLSNVAINSGLADSTWTELAADVAANQSSLGPYIQPDTVCQSTDSRIKAFVASILPTSYKTTMTPLSAARKIFQAIAAKITYQTGVKQDAVSTLLQSKSDCGGYSQLYIACLRSIGIPARAVAGWTASDWHVWTEMYLPKTSWIPQDCTTCSSLCRGAYAYCFAVLPGLNQRCIVCRGCDFLYDGYETSSLQLTWASAWYGGTPPTYSISREFITAGP